MLVNRDGMGVKAFRVVLKPIEGDEFRVLPPFRDPHAEMLIGMAGTPAYPQKPLPSPRPVTATSSLVKPLED